MKRKREIKENQEESSVRKTSVLEDRSGHKPRNVRSLQKLEKVKKKVGGEGSSLEPPERNTRLDLSPVRPSMAF